MDLHIVASGSSGNCYCMNHGGKYIFIDAGVPVSRVKSVCDIGVGADVRLFITHEHTDHIVGFMPFVNRYSPVVYASEKTADILVAKGANPDKIYVLDADCEYDMDDFSVMPFKVAHDAVEPFGYKFNFGDKIISFATDLGVVSDYVRRSLEGTKIMLLESNYEDELLKTSSYPASLKSRIASTKGHLSNKEAHKFVAEMSLCGLKRCFLVHVSESSNDYNLLAKYAKACKDCYDVQTDVVRQRTSMLVSV